MPCAVDRSSPWQATEIEHPVARCDFDIEHVGVRDLEANAPTALHRESLPVECVPAKLLVKRSVAGLAQQKSESCSAGVQRSNRAADGFAGEAAPPPIVTRCDAANAADSHRPRVPP